MVSFVQNTDHVKFEISYYQGMSCEGACAHAHVRIAVARVRAKSILESVREMRACGPFFGCAMCDHTFAHFLS